MNPEELLVLVQGLIENRLSGLDQCAHLCHWDGELRLMSTNHTGEPHPVFMNFGSPELINGLTNQQWDKLLFSLSHFYTRRNQCPKPRKP